jgi:hypothetical protein
MVQQDAAGEEGRDRLNWAFGFKFRHPGKVIAAALSGAVFQTAASADLSLISKV